MTTQQEEEKILFKAYRDYSRFATGLSVRHWHMEVSDVDCLWWIIETIPKEEKSIKVSNYAETIKASRDHDTFFEPDTNGCTHPMVSRGGVCLAALANFRYKTMIQCLLEAGAIPDEDYTKFRYGDSNGVWEYLQEVYTEFRRKKMTKPAFSVHN